MPQVTLLRQCNGPGPRSQQSGTANLAIEHGVLDLEVLGDPLREILGLHGIYGAAVTSRNF